MKILVYLSGGILSAEPAAIFSVHGFDGLAFGVRRQPIGNWRVTELSSGFAVPAEPMLASRADAITLAALVLNMNGMDATRKAIKSARATVADSIGPQALAELDAVNAQALELLK